MAQIKNVTELDFDQIKTNLKVFLSSQDKFNDYDFEGSGINLLLDILAYNTQYNALLSHMTLNESFLDSAQARSNVVSRAKSLGYTPQSKRASTANLKITVTGSDNTPSIIQIPKGTTFSTLIGSTKRTFVTNDIFSATKDGNNQYVFNNVEIKEGSIVNLSYRVDNAIDFQKFKIADPNIDTSTLLVRVRESLTSSEYQTYTQFNNLADVKQDSNVFFLQENTYEQYEIYFGDNVIGNKPRTGQIVDITYISTNGPDGNGAVTFSIDSAIAGLTSILIESAEGFTRTSTGTDKESIESIRYNAPKLYASQKRAVTAEDYESILRAEFDFIEDLTIWGGEVNDPPVYGKVYASIKPFSADFLSESVKTTISQFLKNKNVGSVTPELLDPDYTFITLDIFFKYDPNNTSRTKSQLEAIVRQSVQNYNDEILEKFDGVLRYSKLLNRIDSADQGILNSFARMKMHKHVEPIPGIPASYKLKFCAPIYISEEEEPVLTTNTFIVNGIECQATDISIPGDFPNRTIQIVSVETGQVIIANAGTIYPNESLMEVNDLQIDSTGTIKIFAEPASYDVAPKFNQLVSIEFDETPGITVTGEVDDIAVLGTSGATTYQTFRRHDV